MKIWRNFPIFVVQNNFTKDFCQNIWNKRYCMTLSCLTISLSDWYCSCWITENFHSTHLESSIAHWMSVSDKRKSWINNVKNQLPLNLFAYFGSPISFNQWATSSAFQSIYNVPAHGDLWTCNVQICTPPCNKKPQNLNSLFLCLHANVSREVIGLRGNSEIHFSLTYLHRTTACKWTPQTKCQVRLSEGNELAGDINFNEMLSDAYQVINAATGDLTLIKLHDVDTDTHISQS